MDIEKKHEEDFFRFDVHTTSTKVLVWKIHNLKNVYRIADRLDSPTFSFEDANWRLRIYPNTSSEGEDDCIGFMLVRLGTRVPSHKLNVILMDHICIEKSFELVFDKDREENGDMAFPLRHMEFRLSKFVNSLNLMCQISRCGSRPADASVQTEFLTEDTKDNAVETLCQNFKTLLLNSHDHDVVLKVKDREFRAHQNVLRVRSPVFESMLNHDMKERNSGVIDIPDCEPAAFEQFLLYLYSAKVQTLDADNMLSLYYVADKYYADHLKQECREFIKESVSSRNVTDVIDVALNHGDADLLHCATEYFVKEVNAILPTVEWQTFMKRSTTQANELIIKAFKRVSEGKT